ncbi:MAG: hypothetical protein ACKV19_15290 [Verrucomicrobiales bacterium]
MFPHRPPATRARADEGLWARLGMGVLTLVAAGAVQAAAPMTAFSLPDLNPGSSRVGQPISPPDYREWISAYYFGNEG